MRRSDGRQFERAPAPFEFVSLPQRTSKNKPVGHERWNEDGFTGRLWCELETLSPLHIGSGLFTLADGEVRKEFARSGGKVIIPGSSLKGTFRSIAEAISESCVSKTKSEIRRSLPGGVRQECSDASNVCVCCRIFGAMGYIGRVGFSDAILEDGTLGRYSAPALHSPRPDAKNYRERGSNLYKGRKFYYHGQLAQRNEPWEVIEAGATLRFSVDMENLTSSELCLLLTSMGIIGRLIPKLGGGKPVCLGSVKVSLVKCELRNNLRYSFTNFEDDIMILEDSELETQLAQLKEHGELIRQDALAKLLAIWNYPSQRECPSGNY